MGGRTRVQTPTKGLVISYTEAFDIETLPEVTLTPVKKVDKLHISIQTQFRSKAEISTEVPFYNFSSGVENYLLGLREILTVPCLSCPSQ